VAQPQRRTTDETREPRELRADAKRNRERLLVAADVVFTEHGANASMEDVARRAKVGIGTLYRHFPTREDLLAATVEDRLFALAKRTASQSPGTSPVAALERYLEELVEYASLYRGLAASFGVVLQSCSPACKETTEVGSRLLASAKTAREIRSGVDITDVVCMATAISLAVQQSPEKGRAKRLVSMFVDGLRAPARRG
jgi:AcrR family transcriptional regulator